MALAFTCLIAADDDLIELVYRLRDSLGNGETGLGQSRARHATAHDKSQWGEGLGVGNRRQDKIRIEFAEAVL